jgi:hypothetical protein
MDGRELVLGPNIAAEQRFTLVRSHGSHKVPSELVHTGVQVGQLQRTGVYGGINVCAVDRHRWRCRHFAQP